LHKDKKQDEQTIALLEQFKQMLLKKPIKS
jgi:hypothetical protein